jgi:hypothetical protein
MGKLIRLGEWLRFRKGCEWNHAFIEVDGRVIQATLRGVTDTATLEDIGGRYVLLNLPDLVDPTELLAFAKAQVGLEYGFFTILAIAIDITTWNWFPAFRGARKQSWICSALVGESLRYGGWLRNFVDIYTITPAELYLQLKGTP